MKRALIIARIEGQVDETSEMYHLIWETVFLLIFAEWAAEEILEYSGEKGADQDV